MLQAQVGVSTQVQLLPCGACPYNLCFISSRCRRRVSSCKLASLLLSIAGPSKLQRRAVLLRQTFFLFCKTDLGVQRNHVCCICCMRQLGLLRQGLAAKRSAHHHVLTIVVCVCVCCVRCLCSCVRRLRNQMTCNASWACCATRWLTRSTCTLQLYLMEALCLLLCVQLREAAAQSNDLQRELGLLRQALADKERQLAVLLAETERLQGRPVSSSSSNASSTEQLLR